jgi:hypothetical protein
MSVTEILARRKRGAEASARSLSSLPSPEDARHARVKQAVGVVLAEVDRLRGLERRDEARRRARAEGAEIARKAALKAEHRLAMKHLTITVDKKWFWDLAQSYLSERS